MILEFSISNFLSIQGKETISFESGFADKEETRHVVFMPDGRRVLKLACIYGANASGKTNILYAFDFFLDYILNGFKEMKPSSLIQTKPFRFSENWKGSVSEFQIQFYFKPVGEEEKKRFCYSLAISQEKVQSEELIWFPKTQRKLIFSRSENDVKWGTGMKGGKQIVEMLSANVTLFNVGARLKVPLVEEAYNFLDLFYHDSLSRYRYGNTERCLKSIYKNAEELRPVVMKLLSSMIDDHITDFEMKSNDLPSELIEKLPPEFVEKLRQDEDGLKQFDADIIHQFGDKRYTLPLEWESDGTQRFVELAIPLYRSIKSPTFLSFDEMEFSLHEELLEYFLLTFVDQTSESQILFTTHNLDLMDSDILRDDEIWFANKDGEGASHYSSVSDYTGIRKGVSRKKLYQAGKFGAKPVISEVDLMGDIE